MYNLPVTKLLSRFLEEKKQQQANKSQGKVMFSFLN